jgi:long-chain acyl-CoA synthetase
MSRIVDLSIRGMFDDDVRSASGRWRELTAPGSPVRDRRGARSAATDPHLRQRAAQPARRLAGVAAVADRDYLVYHDERITYAEAHRRWRPSPLAAEHGVGPGDRVAIAMRNYPGVAARLLGHGAIGAAVVGVNAWWVGRELVYG